MGLATGLMVASTAFGVIGSIQEGNAQASEYRYQAAVAEQNAAFAAAEGEVKGTDAGLKEAATVAAIKTAQAARGIDVNKGSAVKVQQSGEQLGQLDVLTIRSDAAREAYGYHTQSAGLKIAAKNAQTAGYINAAGKLFTGLGNIYAYRQTSGLTNPGGGGAGGSTGATVADPMGGSSLIGGSEYIPAPMGSGVGGGAGNRMTIF